MVATATYSYSPAYRRQVINCNDSMQVYHRYTLLYYYFLWFMITHNIYSFGRNVKIIHFIGAAKPWKASFNQKRGPVLNRPENFHLEKHLKKWWQIYSTEVRPRMEQRVSEQFHYILRKLTLQ